MIERVVVIEQQQKALANDTGAMRVMLHEIRNEMQKLVLQEFQRKGERGAVTLMGTLLVGAVTIGGAITSVILWITGHLSSR